MTSGDSGTQAVEQGQSAPPCVLGIFGVSGDLTKRKLIPAVYNLVARNLLSREFATNEVAPDHWDWMENRLYYL